jgi:hypothetical protein
MRLVLVLTLVLVLCTAVFAAKPNRGRAVSTSKVDDVGYERYWPQNEPVEVQMWEVFEPGALGPQYHGVRNWFRVLRWIF